MINEEHYIKVPVKDLEEIVDFIMGGWPYLEDTIEWGLARDEHFKDPVYLAAKKLGEMLNAL